MADDNLDLLDLDDDVECGIPGGDPFAGAARPRKPWLLLGVGLLIILVATYIIIRFIGTGGDAGTQDIDLDKPVVTDTTGAVPAPGDDFTNQADQLVVGGAPGAQKPGQAGTPGAPSGVQKPVAPVPVVVAPKPGAATRAVEDRPVVKFNPTAKPVTATVKPAATKPVVTPTTTTGGGWYVQFAAVASRASAESLVRKMRAEHPSLFSGHQLIILAAEVNGATVYRVRANGFVTGGDANGFCQNAKSDGLECFVAK